MGRPRLMQFWKPQELTTLRETASPPRDASGQIISRLRKNQARPTHPKAGSRFRIARLCRHCWLMACGRFGAQSRFQITPTSEVGGGDGFRSLPAAARLGEGVPLRAKPYPSLEKIDIPPRKRRGRLYRGRIAPTSHARLGPIEALATRQTVASADCPHFTDRWKMRTSLVRRPSPANRHEVHEFETFVLPRQPLRDAPNRPSWATLDEKIIYSER